MESWNTAYTAAGFNRKVVRCLASGDDDFPKDYVSRGDYAAISRCTFVLLLLLLLVLVLVLVLLVLVLLLPLPLLFATPLFPPFSRAHSSTHRVLCLFRPAGTHVSTRS